MNYSVSALALCLLLSGCINQKKIYEPQISSSAEIQLAEAAASISSSLVTLAKTQEHASKPKNKKYVNPDAWGMQGTASIDWSGPIGPLVEHLAKASSYKFRQLGKEPSVPVMVYINAKDQPLAHILRDVHYQANAKADIRVYQTKKVIELRYARNQ